MTLIFLHIMQGLNCCYSHSCNFNLGHIALVDVTEYIAIFDVWIKKVNGIY